MKTRSDTFQFEKELDWKKPAPGIRRQMMGYDGQLMMVKVEFEEGAWLLEDRKSTRLNSSHIL